jgi:hypothetical protein
VNDMAEDNVRHSAVVGCVDKGIERGAMAQDRLADGSGGVCGVKVQRKTARYKQINTYSYGMRQLRARRSVRRRDCYIFQVTERKCIRTYYQLPTVRYG